jgi:hypothetical protein
MPYYRIYELVINSGNFLFPELPCVMAHEDSVDVILKEDFQCHCKVDLDKQVSISFQSCDDYLEISVKNLAIFKVSANSITWHPLRASIDGRELRSYILGSCLGALLAQRGLLVLHGNALVNEGRAIICLGKSGSGKSTLAYSLMSNGWSLLSDDLVAINSDGMVLPGIPRIKLWRNAVVDLNIDEQYVQPIARNSRKYTLESSKVSSAPIPASLSAFYIIDYDPDSKNYEYTDNREASRISYGKIVRFDSRIEALYEIQVHLYRPQILLLLKQEGSSFVRIANLLHAACAYSMTLPTGVREMKQWITEISLQ